MVKNPPQAPQRRKLRPDYGVYPSLETVTFSYTYTELEEIISILEPHLLDILRNPMGRELIIQEIQESGKRLCLFIASQNCDVASGEAVEQYRRLLGLTQQLSMIIGDIDSQHLSIMDRTIEFCAIQHRNNTGKKGKWYIKTPNGIEHIFEYNGSVVSTNTYKLLSETKEKCDILTYFLSQNDPKPERGRPDNLALLRYTWILADHYKEWTGKNIGRGGVFERFCKACITPPNARENLHIHVSSIDRYIRLVKNPVKKAK